MPEVFAEPEDIAQIYDPPCPPHRSNLAKRHGKAKTPHLSGLSLVNTLPEPAGAQPTGCTTIIIRIADPRLHVISAAARGGVIGSLHWAEVGLWGSNDWSADALSHLRLADRIAVDDPLPAIRT